jgi:hypothetical protein
VEAVQECEQPGGYHGPSCLVEARTEPVGPGRTRHVHHTHRRARLRRCESFGKWRDVGTRRADVEVGDIEVSAGAGAHPASARIAP